MGRSHKFILLLTIVLMLGAGVVVGRLWARLPVAVAPTDKPQSYPARELNLTPDQQKEMDAIWSDTRQKIGDTFERRRELDRQRDQAIEELLTEEQKAAYKKIMSDHHQGRGELDKERAQLVKQAEERSRALLDDDQKKRWDAMPRGPRGGPPRPPGSATSPSTRPSWPMRGERPFPGH